MFRYINGRNSTSKKMSTNFKESRKWQMNKYRLLSICFALAGCCYIVGTINHILNTGEGILSSALLAAGCLCLAFAFYKGTKKNEDDRK